LSHGKGQQVKVKYYKDIDTEAVYACVGPMGANAVFRLADPSTKPANWEFLVPDSPIWDAVHQRIYRNPRVEEVNPEEFQPRPPLLPEIPCGPFPEWKEYFLPEQPINASQYPSVTKFLKGQEDETVMVFVVLHEDTYETMLGDGEFHYLGGVFLTREEAQDYMGQNRGEWNRFHLRTMSIKLAHDAFLFPDFRPERYDRYKAEEVLIELEVRLRG
jgi:hypothetical protein